ncbi:MAG: D-amino acid dehydrogenase [Alphaproteobacteria bacterium]|nr:D-amino acid dehydrogenase [Alphaproteobacteria bacterium]
MRVAILGAGVIGVTTAYYLAKSGYKVSVFDRAPGSSQETSYANGIQLSYSHASPWAEPGVIPKIIKWFGDDEAPLVFRFKPDLSLMRWGLSFLKQSSSKHHLYNTASIWRLSSYSRSILHEFLAHESVEFDYLQKGILHIFQHQDELDNAIKQAQYQESLGCDYALLNRQACFEKEPILEQSPYPLAGAIYYPLDEVGNIFTFTQKVTDICKTLGVTFHFNTTIESLHTQQNRVVSMNTNQGVFDFDLYVVALSAYSGALVRPLKIHLPIYPLKGYTLTIAVPENHPLPLPESSITDEANKIVFSRLGNALRVAGTAEVAGFDTSIQKKRIELMKKQTGDIFPAYQHLIHQPGAVQEWACLRSSTPSGVPIIGQSSYSNLYLNTGHGSLGWTMAMGSAKILHDLMVLGKSEIPSDTYAPQKTHHSSQKSS